jgi:hypothetical protein
MRNQFLPREAELSLGEPNMKTVMHRRLLLGLGLLFAAGPLLLAQGQLGPAGNKRPLQLQGKVVPLKDLLEKIGSRLDADAAPYWLALVTDDGKIYPLIKDEGDRMFFTDPKTRNRPMRLTGRLFAGTDLLQVLDIHSIKDGKLCEIYYWCDICSIRRQVGGICECCGGPMELREVPVK